MDYLKEIIEGFIEAIAEGFLILVLLAAVVIAVILVIKSMP